MARFTDRSQVSDALGIPFSDQQLDAITAPLEPGVIIAGAGSGKTTVMAARVVWLVGTGQVRPEQVLGLTFTRKAAAELSSRVREALARAGVVDTDGIDDAGEQLIMTYDAFAARLVADHGLRIGVEGDARMVTGAARFRIASRVVAAAPGPFHQVARLRPDSVTDKVLALDGDLASHLVDPADLVPHAEEFLRDVEQSPRSRTKDLYASMKKAAAVAAERVELAGLVEGYQRAKRQLGAVEFADQMGVAAELARRVPAVSALLREQFAVVLLDEYQDTSSAQAELLKALFSGATAADGRGHPVTAVGDPCQAIYGWRGAAAANIITFAHEFPQADGTPATPYALTVNRRSGQQILDAANALSAPLRADEELQWDGIDTDLVAPPGTPPGDIRVASFDTWPDEVRWVADDIAAAHDSGRARAWSDIAVLARRNAHIRPLYAELVARGIPVEIVGLDGLLQVPEVADVVAVLRVLGDATANPDLVRVLTGPRWAIGPADLAALGRRARDLAGAPSWDDVPPAEQIARIIDTTEAAHAPSLAEALADLGDGPYTAEGRRRMAACAAELASLRAHAGGPVTDLVRRVVTSLGLEVELALRGPGGTRQLDAFVAQVSGYTDVDGDGSLTGLLAWLAAEEDRGVGLEQAVPTASDSVKLLTIHRAKGLEWEDVYLPALADKVFPSDRVQGNWLSASAVLPADLRGDAANVPQLTDVSDAASKGYAQALKDEARRADDRLAYVAVTRARQHLVATTHAWSDLKNPRQHSPYLRVLERFAAEATHAEVSAENPLLGEGRGFPWPAPMDAAARARRAEAAASVERARAGDRPDPDGLLLDEAAVVATWDAAADQLLAEARLRRADAGVALPPYLSATALIALEDDAEGYLAALARPMPRPPRRAARVGELFHAWLERRFVATPALLEDPDEDVATDADLARLVAAFEAGPFADRTPHATEVPFSLFLAGQVVRGRIDAVFTDRGRPEVVDWKTGRGRANPLQLAVYRLAWAELNGLAVDDVDAAFFDVTRGVLVRPSGLPDRAGLERLVGRLTPTR
ncbi:ATP-dependent helicase [Propioniciclava sp. MC1683]|uniref:ATP-dependent DNA helicase n=1 Tax=Propioniciclava sp. MC1683 TaxID=2760309 RepID=UPI0015FF1B08|nr:ATP-dependent DNA helicase [Propioniciclava sp. MC1683]MBB1502178.1 ATP-dependent helicase [Propioniciclava sp. MC1683]